MSPSPSFRRLAAAALLAVTAAGCDSLASPESPETASAAAAASAVVTYSVLEVTERDGAFVGHSRPVWAALGAPGLDHGSLLSAYPGETVQWVINGDIEGLEGASFTLPCDLPAPTLTRSGGDYVYRVEVPMGTTCSGAYDLRLVRSGDRVDDVHLHGSTALGTGSATGAGPSCCHGGGACPPEAMMSSERGTGEIKMPP